MCYLLSRNASLTLTRDFTEKKKACDANATRYRTALTVLSQRRRSPMINVLLYSRKSDRIVNMRVHCVKMLPMLNQEVVLSDHSDCSVHDFSTRQFRPRPFRCQVCAFWLTLTLNNWTVKEHRIGDETICAEKDRQRNRWRRNGRAKKTWSPDF